MVLEVDALHFVSLIPAEPDLAQRVPDKPVVRDDPKLASGKIAFFQYLTVGVFLFLISGFWSIQVRNPDFYSERAELNRIQHREHARTPRAGHVEKRQGVGQPDGHWLSFLISQMVIGFGF